MINEGNLFKYQTDSVIIYWGQCNKDYFVFRYGVLRPNEIYRNYYLFHKYLYDEFSYKTDFYMYIMDWHCFFFNIKEQKFYDILEKEIENPFNRKTWTFF
jgi:hypothetical protein